MFRAKPRVTGKKDFEKLEQSSGLTFCKNGLLFSQPVDIQPVSGVSFDWLHIFLVNGIFQTHWNLMKPALLAIGASHQVMMDYVKVWVAPRDQKANVDASLATLEKSKGKEWKPSASEVLSVYPLLRQLILGRLDRTDDPSHSASLHGFLELLKILDCLSLINKGGTVDPANLHQRTTRYLQLFAASYGPEEMVPKFHYSLHLSAQLEQHGLLISCFTHERKHKSLKVWANQLCNAQSASS